ncbi:hypothetical protein GE061_003000 [Apolygus lucorum]|uniref:ABC transporter domain-containing protein n=1 Tax=Apolygus lucorum TaxID=248454 RepID=A0A8S9X0R9_APOLU|nr:hypothetical protein GE061_003000 [Apolygus lucorum]
MSVSTALFWRAIYWSLSLRIGIILTALAYGYYVLWFKIPFGVLEEGKTKYVAEQHFPKWTRDDVLSNLSRAKVLVYPRNEHSMKLMGEMGKSHPNLSIEFQFKESDIVDPSDNLELRIIFNEISPNRLDYAVFITKDIGLFPLYETPGPATTDLELMEKGHPAIQVAVDEAYMSLFGIPRIDWSVRKNPYPRYQATQSVHTPSTDNRYSFTVSLWLFLLFSSLAPSIRFGQVLVEERFSGVGEILGIYGVNRWYSLISWFLLFSFFFSVMAIYSTCLWRYPIVIKRVLFRKTSTWIILFVLISYFQIFLVLATLVSVFFTDPTQWSVVFMIVAIVPSTLTIQLIKVMNSNLWLLISSLHPVGGLYQCISAIIEFEKNNEGVQWNNFFSRPPVTYNQLAVGESIVCLYVGALLWSLLVIYLELVLPRKYGISKPWDFPCHYFLKSQKPPSPKKESAEVDTPVVKEEIQIEKPVSVEVQQIHKSFGQVKALNGVSFKIYTNQITSLLGENGAGKTTLMGIITGMLAATKGHILVDGQDLYEGRNLEKFRRSLGYCPQNDILMSYLTVQQHLIFFSMLTGVDKNMATSISFEWMDKFQLTLNKNLAVHKLSGGMKRKLTICTSLVRNPKILIMDEPTSGLDPISRRQVWDILFQARKEMTIILTTHRMEEADTLSDYIAILSNGNLRVYGSNEFLKSLYGVEYQVSVVPLSDNLKMDELTDTINKRFGTITMINKSNKSLVLGVKSNDAQEVMRFLERTYGSRVAVSVTSGTIDDVFVQIQREAGVRISVDETDMPSRYDFEHEKRKSLVYSQFINLLAARYYWVRHNWGTFILYILLFPVTACTIAMIFPRFYIPLNIEDGRFNAELSTYGTTTSWISEEKPTNNFSTTFKAMISDQGSTYHVTTQNIEEALISASETNLKLYRSKTIFSVDLKFDMTVYYSSLATLALPIAINMIDNAIIRDNGSQASIRTQIHLQPSFNTSAIFAEPLKFAMIYYFCFEMLNSYTYFMMFPHEQRTSIVKHLQFMTGLNPSLYWLTNFLVDAFLVLIVVATSMTFFVFWDNTVAPEPFFTRRPYFEVTILIFILYGFSCIGLVYIFSFWFKKVLNSMQMFFIVNVGILVVYYSLYVVFSQLKSFPLRTSSVVTAFLNHTFYFIPLIPTFMSLLRTIPTNKVLYNNLDSRGAFDYHETFSELVANVSLEITYLVADIVLYLILVMVIDGQLWRAKRFCRSCREVTYDLSQVDADVLHERDRIQNLNKEDEPYLVASNLTKSYRNRKCGCSSRTAANGVSFGVERGLFFGILGLNGAGKTTTFKMLTGLVYPDKGDAKIQGKNLMKDRWGYMKSMGFCPQSDGLLESMSGKRSLELFGALRGLNGKELKTSVEKWLEIMDMDEIKDRSCGEYSGGNKRKLSVAMSLIGDPSIVFLDEPTTGVDPVVRRKMWSLFKRNQTLGTTFIMTSHSLDESEALCDRVTIMAGGYMKCIGSIGQLKLAYAAGFRMIVRMKINSTEDDTAEITKSLDRSFPSSYILKDEQPLLLSFEITKKDMLWSERFDFISRLKSHVGNINDIVISDSSIEEVYYNVTKQKNNNF